MPLLSPSTTIPIQHGPLTAIDFRSQPVPNRAPAPAQTTAFSALQTNPAASVATDENQWSNLSAMILMLRQQQEQQQQQQQQQYEIQVGFEHFSMQTRDARRTSLTLDCFCVFCLSVSLQTMLQIAQRQLLEQSLMQPSMNLDNSSNLPSNGFLPLPGFLGGHQEPVRTETTATPVQAMASQIGGVGTHTFRQTLEQREGNEDPAASSQQLLQQTNPLNRAQMLLQQQLQQTPQVDYHYASLLHNFPCREPIVNAIRHATPSQTNFCHLLRNPLPALEYVF